MNKLKTLTASDIPTAGAWVSLKEGNLYYRWHYPDEKVSNNETVVLVHGFSTPHFVWDGMKGFLLDAGYSVLVFDHYGRGYSERPRIKYTRDVFVQSLKELLDSQKISESVHLVGYSMGGPVVGHFTSEFPDMVESISLIAPAGFMAENPTKDWWIMKPLVGEWFLNVFGSRLVFQGNEEKSEPSREDPLALSKKEFIKKVEIQMQYKGFINALLSTARNFNFFSTQEMFGDVGNLNKPILTIWGTEDEVVPFMGRKELTNYIPQSELLILEGGKHDITYAEPSMVGAAIRDFLMSQPKAEA
ncbi:MAG: alpha/beta hydrolase [SAR86 cluster bacterium]|jgi:pimeloyl-ACP methyl ester carboxylesterase|uniref:Alpha/beta hydrolase n=1 Tax=SAR86 cluster bacterium TaxID=2030880 RepID=A0A838XWC3_9GAMM|nr:alpha/beta hydrolase [SAR86 cluster bacterium]